MGSAAFAGHVPAQSATVVTRLQAAGAYVMGKTVTAELAYFTPGKTRNPWAPAHTPGGSSSGSAAAVASGFVPLALGTQTNGSVIRPAAFCGVVGYKPSAGLIPRTGIQPFSRTLDQVGVFARSIDDAALFAHCLAGADAHDPASRADAALPPHIALRAAPPRLAAVRSPVWSLADAVAMMVNGALRGAGDTVWPGVATIILSWVLIVGGGHAMVAFAPQLESIGPWVAAALYIVALCITFYARFAAGHWKKIDLVKRGSVAGH